MAIATTRMQRREKPMKHKSKATAKSTPSQDVLVRSKAGRFLVVLGAVVAAGFSIAHASSMATRAKNPQIALSTMPDNAIALASRADLMLLQGKDDPDWTEIQRLALSSLQEQALNPRAARLNGMALLAKGDAEAGRAHMLLAQRLSRRDLPTQLWFTQKCAANNDFPCAMRHMDTALSTKGGGFTLLFPILRAGLGDPAFQQALKPYFREGRLWMPKFIVDSAQTDQVAELAQAMHVAGSYPKDAEYQAAATLVLGRLQQTRDYAEIPRFARLMGPGVSAMTTSAAFTLPNINPDMVPLSWEVMTNPAAVVAFERQANGDDFILAARVDPANRATIARKLMFMPPGVYRTSFAGEINREATAAAAGLTVSCLSKTNQVEVAQVPVNRARGKTAVRDIQIGSDCTAQMVEIFLTGGSSDDGATIQVNRVSLKKLDSRTVVDAVNSPDISESPPSNARID